MKLGFVKHLQPTMMGLNLKPIQMMKNDLSRRQFIHKSALTTATLATTGPLLKRKMNAQGQSSNRIRVGVMGLSRGMSHVKNALRSPNVDVAYVCDVDQQRIDSAVSVVEKQNAPKPKGVRDFRRMLEDKEVDAIMIATCNHWHAPATILACSAGKHVYVEKPGSHNPQEGFWMVQAARKHQRVVQMGNQRRSWPAIQEAMARLHSGVIGETTFARCWYDNARGSIGKGKQIPFPRT